MAGGLKLGKGAVVVTGTSTGIGAASAMHLDSLGFCVFAGVRREKDGETLAQKSAGRITPLVIDVTDEGSMTAAAETVAATVGDAGLFGLVNNAGIAVAGPLEFLPLFEIRKQFDVNVVGPIAVAQAFLPLLRASRGRIVNIGSIAGRMAMPFMGPYSASKFALEAITDALRIELRPWGISVSIIEPGEVATPIWRKSLAATKQTAQNFPPGASALYDASLKAVMAAAEQAAGGGMDPDRIARAVAVALTAKNPKTRYLVGRGVRLRAFLKKTLPDRRLDRLLIRQLGLP
ncbi:MAG TPA: SDR family oxidoreductase [Candidatus Manganitrophaceae bacterium]|nr:SDR family oxidoreductase [Candidatus Manganitrophaceae bacterium]